MRLKRIALLLTCVFTISSLSACGFVDGVVEETKKDIEFTKENDALTDGNSGVELPTFDNQKSDEATARSELKIGETASFSVEEDGSMDVTVTDWGTSKNELTGKDTIYFAVEFKNTGSSAVGIAPAIFSVYADDYSVELSYSADDVLQATSLDGGRKASGRVYAEVNADSVEKLEVQLANTVWVLKGAESTESGASEGENTADTGVTSNTDIPEVVLSDKEDLGNIAGMYWNFADDSNIEINLYSSPEGSVVGNATVYYSESPAYTGEIEKVATNIYHLSLDGADIYFGFYTETTGDEKALRMQLVINGNEEDWYYRSEEFVS